jgi:peptide deformylase
VTLPFRAVASTSKSERREAEREEELRVRAQRQIRQFPDPVLKQRAREVELFDEDLVALVDRMEGLMDDAHGAGLAAPQIGLLRRLFVYHAGEERGTVAVVNPEILAASDERTTDGEGCLSLALLIDEGHTVPVSRHDSLTLRAADVFGVVTEREVSGHEARVIQHELDHLDGVLILDRTSADGRRDAMRLLRGALT